MILLDCIQGSETWLDARKFIPTSSKFDKIITSTGKASSSANEYMNKLLAEYVDPDQAESFKSKAMERGNEMEPKAKELYQQLTGFKVREVGGIFLDENRETICSPDGLIESEKRGLEIKCPNLNTHIGYVRAGVMPTKYIIQVQSGMLFSGYKTWDFMSYHPSYRPLILTIKRDEILIKKIKESVLYFSEQLKKEKAEIDEYLNVEF
jgi:hypothetical protein